MNAEPTVYVVDDDPAVLKSLKWLIESARLRVKTYPSGPAFLESWEPECCGCLVVDMRMPGLNGLEVQERLAHMGEKLPVIVMTGHGDVATCTKSFQAGAFDFIEKPADDGYLLNRIAQAMAVDLERRRLEASRSEVAARIAELTPRELEVMGLIAHGRTLKQIARECHISVQTVAKHRARVLDKLRVHSDVEVARLVPQALAT